MLALAFIWTVAVKFQIVRQTAEARYLVGWATVVFPDFVFFGALSLAFALAGLYKPRPIVARGMLLISALVLAWAVANAAWLIATGVQIQPGILWTLAQEPMQFWPVVRTHLAQRLSYAVLFSVTIIAGFVWFLYRLVRPTRMSHVRQRYTRRAWCTAIVVLVGIAGQFACRAQTNLGLAGAALGFSAHWHALVSIVHSIWRSETYIVSSRWIPHANERRIVLPVSHDKLPNIVVVLLESVSHRVTSLGNAKLDTTPKLKELAASGVEFRMTRVPVPHTTEAFWTVATGTRPDLQGDYAEAVLVKTPYEGLPTILSRCGYRSAFFQMSKGTFECAPGLFSNLGFDWAWFRENLEDSSAHLGYLGGDDLRMLEPAMAWATSASSPFFLMMITSAQHDPFEVPTWFGKDQDTRWKKYLQAVQYGDHFLGKLHAVLTEWGLSENTLLCIMGDHGESFRTQGRRSRWLPHEEVIRVPWVIYWPDHIKAGQCIDWPCSQLDLAPTILRLIGFDINEAGFEGKDAFEPSSPGRRHYFMSWHSNSPRGYIEGNLKWVYWPYTDEVFEYDLAADPHEDAPRKVGGPLREKIIADLDRWVREAKITIPPRRFTQEFLYGHWRAFASGRSAWAYYVP